ncbi:DUF2752 domain-containing protein [Nocardioides sp.]|uniref:DUF2752 domain-containing protein n=1 Tax=Nocardioides sp. TaxID=35761 RepID=UPI00271ED55D|nr:DUF2752 domain-containing protein [Nocardioides sp.]MDO9455097.1 DUF2752 domain-containing protein [Nocardioides sp.]
MATTVTTPPAATVERGRPRRLAGPAATVAGLGAATVALALRDPHTHGSWGLCPSQALGFDCPGCGGLRAVNDLTHGRFLDAASSNVFLVVAIPVVVALLGRWALDAWRGTERGASALTTPLLVVAFTALAVFTVLRNVPAFGWLAS